MARAIVTYARGWHALAITRSLGKKGIEVYCGEEAPFAPCFFSRYCKGSFQYPSVSEDPAGFLDFLEEKVKELKPADGEPYVLMPVHKETWLIAEHRDRFEPHIRLALTTHENMARTHDKGRLAVLAKEHGIRIPQTWEYRSIDELYRAVPDLEFPVFLKMRESASGVGLKKCDTPEELTATFKEFVEGYDLQPDAYPLVQQFVKGDDYCVTTVFNHGRCVAHMTYHNLRVFPRGTGASALRETVSLPEAEQASIKLLSQLNWHGMAQLDYRQAEGGPAYLIEINPRFFGGLSQAVAANVDYPHLVFRIACGEEITEAPEVDYAARTETPITGLLATLQEIAHDDENLERLRRMRTELTALGKTDVKDVHLRSFWESLKSAAAPKDVMAYLKNMFEVHRNTIDDVIHADDPLPALGILYPIALMLKHGKISMGVLTSEADLSEGKPRRRFRDMLLRPRWATLLLAALLFAVAVFTMNWAPTSGNLGVVLGWPGQVSSWLFGTGHDLSTIAGALRYTAYHGSNLLFLYFCAALLLRQKRPRKAEEEA